MLEQGKLLEELLIVFKDTGAEDVGGGGVMKQTARFEMNVFDSKVYEEEE